MSGASSGVIAQINGTQADLKLFTGNDIELRIQIHDSNENIVDASGYAVRLQARYTYDSDDIIIDCKTSGLASVTSVVTGSIVWNVSLNAFVITIDDTESANLPFENMIYQLKVRDDSDAEFVYMSGDIEVIPQIAAL